ncbi:2',3'-cyclic-nucleotide 2'-phosphodiesterase/5'-or 3'-nucleotidase, 5'-nucleotidase family [Algoriphagus alkaliphilus]|uniref:2',3'-cyclic-nucleotide 2'-phosphodiesterase/5'-or 3'-nucleotidase, 5'-nucleotidase family n=1 Tax=Algoriphagus alkaliphilus TaxID=279824 RepID=A0A1G5X148_9BACT|nr:bifunctional metallophosphatase/5'-nucleotidase [Algoriphagus alkaliphilus]SDA63814.1 2',3'-cyclic-nucleotide 2'-phosphodiesterase/5'-or 3'-nucleotidase, 5'-nucleotidase family [Algoriphagus alkaliphilus]
MKSSRRKFIAQLGALGASTGLAGIASGAPSSEINNPENPSTSFTLNILQTTDVHCQIHAHDELFWENGKAVYRKTGGYAHLKTFLDQKREKMQHSFLMDTGDMFQGSELSVKTTGEAMVPILNALDYDLYLPGNWEVIYYKKSMQHLLGSLSAPKVCANMYHDLGEGKKGELIFHPYHIWAVNGVKIGFLGYTDHLVPLRQSPNYSKGIIYTKPEENLAHYVEVLRNQEKCAFVAIVAHLGLSQQIHLANHPACEGVDYILGGDTHERVRVPIQAKYAKVVEPGAFGSFVGKLELKIKDGKVVSDTYELMEVDSKKYPESPKMKEIIAQYEGPYLEDIQKVVGYSTIPLFRYFVIENTIDTMILDAIDWQVPDVDIVLSNGFRFCPPRSTPDHTGNIPITNGFIFDMLPVDSTIRTGKVTGKQIQEWLEQELNNVFAADASKRFGGWVIKFKGMEVKFNAFGEEGKRVQSAMVHGLPLDLEKVYKICACERDGDPDDMLCRFRGVKDTQNTAFTLHQAMKNYLGENSPVTPTPPKSAEALDAPATLLTQVSGVDYEFR